MTEQVYDAKKFALELGFGEDDAETLKNANATNIRRIARSQGLLPESKTGKTPEPSKTPEQPASADKVHKHFYRKDNTCACGAIKGVKAVKVSAEEKARIQAVAEQEARAWMEAEAANRPTYEGQFEGQFPPPDENVGKDTPPPEE